MSPERGTFTLLPNDINMTTFTFAFSDDQISLLRTSLDTRINRIDDMIVIFSSTPEDKDTVWMKGRYELERAQATDLLKLLTNI